MYTKSSLAFQRENTRITCGTLVRHSNYKPTPRRKNLHSTNTPNIVSHIDLFDRVGGTKVGRAHHASNDFDLTSDIIAHQPKVHHTTRILDSNAMPILQRRQGPPPFLAPPPKPIPSREQRHQRRNIRRTGDCIKARRDGSSIGKTFQ